MARIRLEIDHLKIHRPKRRWKLYFVVAAEHPEDNDKMLVSVIPQKQIMVVPDQHNEVTFEDDSAGANGLFVLSREMPDTRELNVHLYVMHTRRKLSEIANILSDIDDGISGNAFGLLTDVLGKANPWLVIARKALPMVGQILEKTPDRNMGFVSMFERFGDEFENEVEIDREARGGHISVVYSWSVE